MTPEEPGGKITPTGSRAPKVVPSLWQQSGPIDLASDRDQVPKQVEGKDSLRRTRLQFLCARSAGHGPEARAAERPRSRGGAQPVAKQVLGLRQALAVADRAWGKVYDCDMMSEVLAAGPETIYLQLEV